MSILNIVLLSLIILISLATLVLLIYDDGVEGVIAFILQLILEFFLIPILSLIIQFVLNCYGCLVTGTPLSREFGGLIMYHPITVLLISGLVVSIFIFFLKLSDTTFYVNAKYEEEDEVEENEKNI